MRSRFLKAYTGLVDAAALVVLVLASSEGFGDRIGTLLTLIVLSILVGSRPVRVPALHVQVVALDLFVLCAIVALSAPAAPLVGLAGVASAVLGPARRPLSIRTAFNLGAIPLAAGLAALAYGPLLSEGTPLLGRYGLPLLAATAVYFLVNTALAALAIAVERRRNVLAVWWGYAPWNAAATLTSMLVGLGLAILLGTIGPAVLVLGLVAAIPLLSQGKLEAAGSRPAG